MTDPGDRRAEPVSAALRDFAWDNREAAAYEAAIEAINETIGAYSARIHAEQAKPSPDDGVVAELRQGRLEAVRAQERLDPTNHAQIGEARETFTAKADVVAAGGT